jgi:EmrB/QacA subfamily drug resistance transporter
MVVLDVSVVNVALPSIRTDLGFSTSNLQWVVNAYTLTFGGLLLLGGRVVDLIGSRRTALVGLILFGATSLLGGVAHNSAELITARAIQGVAGALLLPVSLTIITTTFAEGAERQRALAAWGAVAGAGVAIGVLLGGVLTQELDWRWVLFVNVPIAVVGAALTLTSISRREKSRRVRMDAVGAVLITVALVSLVYSVVSTNQYSWSSPRVYVPLVVAGVLGTAFVIFEQRVAAEPLVRFGILRNRSLLVANTVFFLLATAQFGTFYLVSLYLQDVLHYDPLETGLAFIPFSVGVVAGSFVAGKLVPRFGARRLLVIGLVSGAFGTAWFGFVSAQGTFLLGVLGPSIVASIGIGICFIANTTAATTGVARDEAGLASGILNACRQCGGSVGLALLVTVANTATREHTHVGLTVPSELAAGYDRAFFVASILIGLAAVIAAFFLPRSRPRPARPISVTPQNQTG